MTEITENGLTILRVLSELGAVGWNDLKSIPREIFPLTHLSKDEFAKARKFIEGQGYAKFVNNSEGALIITSPGLEYLDSLMSVRYNLNLNAERILKHLVSLPLGQQRATRAELKSALNLDDERYDTACQQLEDYKLIKYAATTGEFFGDIKPTDEGRQAVLRNFQDPQAASPFIQTGPIFTGTVTAQNFQAITSVINSQIEQSITENDPEILKAQATEIIELLVNQISSELPLEKKSIYTQAALELSEEIKKPDRDIEKLQKLISILSLLDKAVSLGDKTIQLANKALPTVLLLLKIIQGLPH